MTKHRKEIVEDVGEKLLTQLDNWDAQGYDLISITQIQEAGTVISDFIQHSYPAQYLLILKKRDICIKKV